MPQDNPFKLLTNEAWKKDWWVLLLVKLVLAAYLPFFSDEAYYWTWSHNLKLSYFDHPPFISWLFLISQPLENFHFAARIPTVLLGHLTIWVWCSFLAANLDSERKRLFFWILSLHTLIGLGSIVANPDVPFLFFWSLSILFYLKSLDDVSSKKWPLLLGISLGLGFDSKYLIALFVPVAFLHLIISKKWRTLRWQHLCLPIFFGALFSFPVWFWNFQNDWQSFKFQVNHGLGKSWHFNWTTDFILGTSLLLFPPFLYLFFKNRLYKNISDFHLVLFVSLSGFFIYTTTGGSTELNWPLALYPSFFLFIFTAPMTRRYFQSYFWFYGLLSFILLATAFLNPQKPIHPRLVEGALYQKILTQAQAYAPLYTSTYQSASYFWFISKKPYFKLRYASRPDEYDFMNESQPTESFYFLKERYQIIPSQQLLKFTFSKVADLDSDFEIYRATPLQ